MPSDTPRPEDRHDEHAPGEAAPDQDAGETGTGEESEAERREREIREQQRIAGDPPLEHLASGRHDEESEELREDDRQTPYPPA